MAWVLGNRDAATFTPPASILLWRGLRYTASLPLRLLAVAALVFCLATTAPAGETVSLPVVNSDGNTVFRLDLFGAGQLYWRDGSEDSVGARDFFQAEKDDLLRGLSYWTSVLKPHGSPATPVIIRAGVRPEEDYNAFANFYAGDYDTGRVFSALEGGPDASPQPSGLPDGGGAHVLMGFNNYAWTTQPNSQLPETTDTMAPTMIHELGHALGIVEAYNKFAGYLNQKSGSASANAAPWFFEGFEAKNLFGASVPMAHSSPQEKSHFGLRNGLMTHAQITNYPMFMEVELAALQDIGYTIDRKNFFGHSYYYQEQSGTDLDNNVGFFHSRGLDANGGWLGYDESLPNTSPFGVGLHIYGDSYRITQRANLLAGGSGGAAIRVDGFDNTVIIPGGVVAAADGAQGTGLLVSFGNGHEIVSRGVIRAAGPGGVAARFDFGAPYAGETLASYGNYYSNPDTDYYNSDTDFDRATAPIDGPLVKAFHLSGLLQGGPSVPGGQFFSGQWFDNEARPIALLIGPNAHVDNINVMNGAAIEGDIISLWDPEKNGHTLQNNPDNYRTALSFGPAMDNSSGAAITQSSDPNFFLRYRGNIQGAAGLDVSLDGGTLDYAGTVNAHSFTLSRDTTLRVAFSDKGPTSINAETVTLGDSGDPAHIEFRPEPFAYGPYPAAGAAPVLVFDTPALTNNSELEQSSGSFAVGPYDYSWNGLAWNAEVRSVLTQTARSFNHQRGATDARNAPLALMMHNPGVDAVNERLMRLFARRTKHESALLSAAFTGKNSLNGMDLSNGRLMPFLTDSTTPLARERHAASLGRPDSARPEWFAFADGGWEVQSGQNSLWVSPAYTLTEHSGRRDYTIRGGGVAFGVDRQFTDFFSLGLAVTLDFPQYRSDDAKTDARSVTGLLYAGLDLPWELELGLTAFLGETRFEQSRDAPDRTHKSDFFGHTSGAGVTLGQRFHPTDKLLLRPFASWDFFHLERASHREETGPFALRYDNADNNLHRFRAGLGAAYSFDIGHIAGRAFWSGLRGDTKDKSRAAFVQDPSDLAFRAPLDGLDRDSLGLAADLSLRLSQNTRLTLGYTFFGGESTRAHQAMLGLGLDF